MWLSRYFFGRVIGCLLNLPKTFYKLFIYLAYCKLCGVTLAHPFAKSAAKTNNEHCTHHPPETSEQKHQRHFLHSSPQRPLWRRNSSALPLQCPPWLGPGMCLVVQLLRRNHSGCCHWALERSRRNSPEVSAQKRRLETVMYGDRTYFKTQCLVLNSNLKLS